MSFEIVDTLTPQIEEFLWTKYQNAYLSGVYLRIRFLSQDIELKFFCYCDDSLSLSDVLVFYSCHDTIVVVNWLLEISDALAASFKEVVFEQFKDVSRIIWQMTPNKVGLNNSLSFVDNSDMCINLPHTVEDYNKMLGSNSRKLYGKKTRRVLRDLERIVIDEPCDESNIYMVDKLTEWKDHQMAERGEKNKVSPEFLKSMLLNLGSVSYVIADDRVACVCLFYKIGKHVYYEQTAYDESYAWYSLGRVVTYQSILTFIEQGMSHFHFLWKGADYKNHYAAHEVPLYVSYTYRCKGIRFYKDLTKIKTRLLLRCIARTEVGKSLRHWIT